MWVSLCSSYFARGYGSSYTTCIHLDLLLYIFLIKHQSSFRVPFVWLLLESDIYSSVVFILVVNLWVSTTWLTYLYI